MKAFRVALLVLAVLFSKIGFSQSKQYQFVRLDMTYGLSHHMVNDIVKDERGFLWFATSSGLNRYDGYGIKVFRNIPGDTTSVLVDDITRLHEGPDGMLWIYTHSGNSVYDPRTEKFIRNTDYVLRRLGIAQGLITSIKKDRKGNFWFIHYNQGMFLYNPQSQKTVRLRHDPKDEATIATDQMSQIEEDTNGDMWLIHQNGLFEKIDHKTLKVVYRNSALKERFGGEQFEYHVMVDSDNDLWLHNDRNYGCFFFNMKTQQLEAVNSNSRIKLKSNIVRKIVQDENGILWVGTDHGGINLIDKKDFSIRYLMNDDEDERTISENSIQSLYKDNEGIIWIGTYKNGINYYHENIFRFRHYKHQASKPESLPFNDVNAFAEDKAGNIWIGTNGGGLICFNRKTNSFKKYVNNPNDPNSLSNNVIVSLLFDHENKLWIGTYYGGLNKFDGKNFKRYSHDPKNPRSVGDDSIWEIFEDSNNDIWVGTLKSGISVYNRAKDEFYHYRNGDPNSVHTGYVPALHEDRQGNMWVGTGYGLEVLDKLSGRFTHYLNNPNDPTSIASNGTLCIFEDSRDLIWIGTQGGLNLYDPQTKTFRTFLERDGLKEKIILTLIEDDQKNLWMSTPNGLSKLIIKSDGAGYDFKFKNFDQSDGLINGAFRENAVLKCSSGELVYGGSNGFNIFQPENIGVDKSQPKVIFTDFQIFNKSVAVGEEINNNLVLSSAIGLMDEITLKPANNVFSIEFAALNFFHAEKSQYTYMMEGFNREWLTTNASERKITFTNLDPGTYTFKVKASNSDGTWMDEAAVLKIRILPPFWKSNIAFALYGIFIIGTLLLLRYLTVTRERVKFRIQQERTQAQRLHELDMMKIKFFTNVSHEFRTPLTLILTPLEKLLKNSKDAEDKKQFQLIQRNARRLLNLVNQLLDFRRLEVQEVKLNSSEGDIVAFIRELVYSFADVSEKKHVALSFNSTVSTLETHFDQDKVEKIVFNLLSNAFKFTRESGRVSVDLGMVDEKESSFLEIKVIDTGIGIPADKLDRVFERFFQNELPASMVNQGNGIGLSITQEFVRIHGGVIDVTSEVGKGSTFRVLLPVTKLEHHEETAIEHREVHEDVENLLESLEESVSESKPSLLLVEDNEDFRFYLKDNLHKEYNVIEASNGVQGFERALKNIPDLIVSDIMMPEMDGIQLCKKIKSDPTTSHIPVILLTARAAEDQKIEGFESGANDYITKPFNFEILQSRIRNLIEQRETIQKHFAKHLEIKGSEIQVTSQDEKLIRNAILSVEENLTNKDFSVEELSRQMGMSRVLLYKKILALTGKTPIEFIRTIRLQRAAQLLEKSQFTVSEIAYQVGFNNPKYFAKYFKEEFHLLPSAYASEKKEKKV
jgi:signal transduction histidine kinase/ligand-binding sensor domain-containing protein/DNA-binding response OmpR family regulator